MSITLNRSKHSLRLKQSIGGVRLNKAIEACANKNVIDFSEAFSLKRKVHEAESKYREYMFLDALFKEIKKIQKYVRWASDLEVFKPVETTVDKPEKNLEPCLLDLSISSAQPSQEWDVSFKICHEEIVLVIFKSSLIAALMANFSESSNIQLASKSEVLRIANAQSKETFDVDMSALKLIIPNEALPISGAQLKDGSISSKRDDNEFAALKELSDMLNERLPTLKKKPGGILFGGDMPKGDYYEASIEKFGQTSAQFILRLKKSDNQREGFIAQVNQKMFINQHKYETNTLYRAMTDLDHFLRKSTTAGLKRKAAEEKVKISNFESHLYESASN